VRRSVHAGLLCALACGATAERETTPEPEPVVEHPVDETPQASAGCVGELTAVFADADGDRAFVLARVPKEDLGAEPDVITPLPDYDADATPGWILSEQAPCRVEAGEVFMQSGYQMDWRMQRISGECSRGELSMWEGAEVVQWLALRTEETPSCHLAMPEVTDRNGTRLDVVQDPEPEHLDWAERPPPPEIAREWTVPECEECRLGWQLRTVEGEGWRVRELAGTWVVEGDEWAWCDDRAREQVWLVIEAGGERRVVDLGPEARLFAALHDDGGLHAVIVRTFGELGVLSPTLEELGETHAAYLVEGGELPPRGMGPRCDDM